MVRNDKPVDDDQKALPNAGERLMTLSRRHSVAAILFAVAAATTYVSYEHFSNRGRLPEGLIQVNGRIEGDHIAVASKFTGKVDRLLTREGDSVAQGQVMVELDDTQTRAKVQQSRKAFDAVEAQVQAAHTSLAILNLEVPLAIEAADAGVANARAVLEKTKAVEYEARRDAERIKPLAVEKATSQQQLDQAESRWRVSQTEIASANSALAKTLKELALAELGWKRIRAKEADVAALERQRDQAEAAVAEAESILADLTITAPSNGTITTRMVDIGEVVAAGAPLFEVVDLDHLYLKVYVPEVQIGKVHLGLPARVYVDAFPDQAFPGTVRYIASKAEFTPKEVQTPDERVKLIYAVKVYVSENPEHRLTPGLPADAVIRWKDTVGWMKPRW
jgi:HlyD family secretion protein